jgi:hypothetical protein
VVQPRATVIGNVSDRDEFDRKVLTVCVDKGQKSSDVELENAVRERLIAIFETTGLKCLIQFELGRQGEFVGGRSASSFGTPPRTGHLTRCPWMHHNPGTPNRARSDLCGGRAAMRVRTAILTGGPIDAAEPRSRPQLPTAAGRQTRSARSDRSTAAERFGIAQSRIYDATSALRGHRPSRSNKCGPQVA